MRNEYLESVDCSIIPRALTVYTQKWHIICQIFTYFPRTSLLHYSSESQQNVDAGVLKKKEQEEERRKLPCIKIFSWRET